MKSLFNKVNSTCDDLVYNLCFVRISPSQVFCKIVALKVSVNSQEKYTEECYV